MGLYLDYNASTPVDDRVLEKMIEVYRYHYGNADSRTHQYGSDAKGLVENARQSLASLFGVKREAVYFTSGSTESNNLVLLGMEYEGRQRNKKHIVTTAIEHKSVLEPAKVMEQRGFEVGYVFPHSDGRVHAEDVLEKIREDTLLVSIMHVNNETGTIQPVKEVGDALKDTDVYFHIDASQSCGKLVPEIQQLSYDFMSVSAHKMYGPQGIGVLIIRDKNGRIPNIRPLMFGGGQERGLRPGTLPSALIAGMGEAADILLREHAENRIRYRENKQILLRVLDRHDIDYMINGDPQYGTDTTVNISFHNYDSEALMLAMKEIAGISNGSACTSHSYEPSYVLRAMGLPKQRIEEAVRMSWGKDKLDEGVFEKLAEIVKAWQ